mgnify:CR=1 FL=1
MRTDPTKLCFETSADIADYVTKGFPASKKNYAAFKDALLYPVEEISKENEGKKVMVPRRIIENLTQDELFSILDKMYSNQRKNTAVAIIAGIAIAITAGTIGALIGGAKADKEWEDKMSSVTYNF